MRVWWSISTANWLANGASTAVTIAAAPGWRATPQQGYQSRFTPQGGSASHRDPRDRPSTCRAAFDRPFATACGRQTVAPALLSELEKLTRSRCPRWSSKFFFGLLWRNTEEGYFVRPALRRQFRDESGLEAAPASPACRAANTGNWSPAASRITPNPSACSTSRPAGQLSMRRSFPKHVIISSATATGITEMSATKLKSRRCRLSWAVAWSARSCRWNWPAPG